MSGAKKRRHRQNEPREKGQPAALAERKGAPVAPQPLPRHLSLTLEVLGSPAAFALGLALAVALRAWNLQCFSRSPMADALILDHQAYDAWAQRIAAGDWLGHGIFWVDPLYPYVLALVYTVAGHRFAVVRALQAVLGVLNVAMTGLLARRVSESRAVGNLAVLIAALYLPAIHNEVQLEKAILTTSLLNAALLLYLRNTPRALCASGVVLGLGVLARGNLLLLVPAGALALLFARSSGASQASMASGPAAPRPVLYRRGRLRIERAGLKHALIFGLSASAVVGALTVRNVVVGRSLVLTTANLGQNLYIGQQRSNVDGSYKAPDFVRPDPEHEEGDFRAEAERRTGRTLDAAATSAYWAGQAVQEMTAEPAATLDRSWRKLRLVFHEFEMPDNDDVLIAAHFSPVLKAPFFWMGQLAPWALLYALVAFRRSRATRVLAAVIVLYAATLVLFFVVGRFRQPIVPAVIALAAAGLAWLAAKVWARDWSRALPAVGFVGLVALFTLHDSPWIAAARNTSLAVAYNNVGSQLLAAHDTPGAIAAYEQAIAINPAGVVGAMRTLGDIYLEQGDYDNAERAMQLVLEHKPSSQMGRAALVRLYETMARDPRLAGDASVRRRLADAYRGAGRESDAAAIAGGDAGSVATTSSVATPSSVASAPATPGATGGDRARALVAESRGYTAAGRFTEAIAALQEAARVGPYDEGVHYNLGNLMTDHASPEALIDYFQSTIGSDPKPQTSLYFWAIGLERQGDLEGAQAKLAEALDVDPAHEMSELRWCQILAHGGDREGALRHCDKAVEIFPDFRGAHEERARILGELGRAVEAASAAEAARRSNPNTLRRFSYWGKYLYGQGRYAAAAAELKLAVDADPQDAESARLLREARARLTAPASGARPGTAAPKGR